MKNTLISSILIFVSIIVYADSIPILESKAKNYGSTIRHYEGVIGNDDNYYYNLVIETLPVLEKYNKKMELVQSEDINYHKRIFANYDTVFFTYFKDSIYIIYPEVKLKYTLLWARTIDKETFKLHDNERLLANIKHVKGFYPDFVVKQSINRNKLLIIGKTAVHWSRSVTLDMMVFNAGLQQDWVRNDVLNYNDKPPREWEYSIDDEGNMHILTKIYEIRLISHAFSGQAEKNGYLIISVTNNGNYIQSNELFLKDKFIRSIKLTEGPKGTFVCSGYYSNDYKYGSSGVFFISSAEQTNEMRAPLLYEFKADLLARIIPEKQANKENAELLLFKCATFRQLDNGNFILIGQQEMDRTYDNFNDLVITCFSPHGDIIWNEVVNKKQSGFKHTSFAFVNPNDQSSFKLVFNEHPKNDFTPMYSKHMRTSGFPGPYYIKVVEFNEFGERKQFRFKETRRERPTPMPKRIYDLRNGTIIMPTNHYNKYQLFELTLF
ncbi:MAG: hypothetical protein MI922_09280 [Bacteroidales bacterium]|nr:hypothetical protein [Bacteroidales bacterium]